MMIHRRRIAAGLAALTLAPSLLHAHEARRGPNGGQLVDLGDGHAELVAQGNKLQLFLFDAGDKLRPAAGATAQATVLVGGKSLTVVLAPVRDNLMQGEGDFAAARGMRVVVTLTLPGKKPAQARFAPLDNA